VLRELEVKTSLPGTGPAFEHPAKEKLDFNNPIDTINRHKDHNDYWFGNKNGEMATNQAANINVVHKINPADSVVSKIIVYNPDCARGFKFYDKDGKCVLETPTSGD